MTGINIGGLAAMAVCCGGEWCRMNMSVDQTVGTFPNAPAIEFDPDVSVNDYPAVFEFHEGVSGVPLSVGFLVDAIYSADVYIQIHTANPTNGYELSIVGTSMEQADDWNDYVDPRGSLYRYATLVFRGGPGDSMFMYPYVRTISGNSSFQIDADSTFMEIHKLVDIAAA